LSVFVIISGAPSSTPPRAVSLRVSSRSATSLRSVAAVRQTLRRWPTVVRASETRFEAVKRALGLNKRFISTIDRVPQEGEGADDGVLFVVSAQLAGNGTHEDTPTEVPTDIPGETPTEVPAEAPPEVPLGAPADDVEEQVLTA
jgi:hypothetical protein